MTFDVFFRTASYLTIACGAFALTVSGGLSAWLTVVFALVLTVAWKLEETKRQLSERVALIVVIVALPLFYFDWLFQTGSGGAGQNRANVGALVHFTLFLSSIKLLQVKANRDWLFLYVISFFEVLLAAGLSVSPRFFAVLCLYVLLAITTIVSFEIRRAAREAGTVKNLTSKREAIRLPFISFGLLVLIFVLAVPVFFVAPRFDSSALSRSDDRGVSLVGFSNTMRLGDIGTLQQNNEIVMRVRLDKSPGEIFSDLRWRAIAFDHFDGIEWQKSDDSFPPVPHDRNLFQLGTIDDIERLTTQTFFIEPLDTPVLFAASRVVALHGALPGVRVDSESALFANRRSFERISYRAYSDTEAPSPDVLRADRRTYNSSVARHLQLPPALDSRIANLAREVAEQAGARNRYDTSRAIEAYLSQTFGYTLQMRATGSDPLADFLFRVREGHCEYFSSAMVVMLRAQGIAARVVNGFQMGEYNSASDAYTVRQRHAHSWVEVYFPESRAWVTFDPTPAAGRVSASAGGTWRAQFEKYTDAFELFWIQYVVAYDRQEQRTLAGALRNRFNSYERAAIQKWDEVRTALAALNKLSVGGAKLNDSVFAVFLLLTGGGFVIALFVLVKRIRSSKRARQRTVSTVTDERTTVVVFYERMMQLLEARGLRRAADQTPLEHAAATGIIDALYITRAYHRVRYGAQNLSPTETAEIESRLRRMEISEQ